MKVIEKLTKLIDVKSIVTLALTFTFISIVLAQLDIKDNVFQLFNTLISTVFGYYFGKKDTTEIK